MRYLLDANVFIEAKNRYYAFDICPGFWMWMDDICAPGNEVGSIRNVRDELMAGSDELAAWVKDRRDAAWFLKVDDAGTQNVFADIATDIAGGVYTPSAQREFLKGADPWLIAKAKTLNATLVTHELPEPYSKKRVPIPNVCATFGVRCLNTFDTLRSYSTTFHFQP